MSAEGDNFMHRVKGGVSEVCHQFLFLCNPDGESVGKKVRDQLREYHLDEVDVENHEHRQRHWSGCLRKGREYQDADGGAGVGAVGLCT